MKINAFVVIIYAIIVLIGGCIGFWMAGSTASLFMGTVFAVALGAAGWSMNKGSLYGKRWAMILSAILALFFTYRYIIALKFMPAGFMILFSVFVLLALFIDKKKGNGAAA